MAVDMYINHRWNKTCTYLRSVIEMSLETPVVRPCEHLLLSPTASCITVLFAPTASCIIVLHVSQHCYAGAPVKSLI